MKRASLVLICLTLVLSGCSVSFRDRSGNRPPEPENGPKESAAASAAGAQAQLPPGTTLTAGATATSAAEPAEDERAVEREFRREKRGESGPLSTRPPSVASVPAKYAAREPVKEIKVVPSSSLGLNCKAYLSDGIVSLDRLAVRVGKGYEVHLVCRDFTRKPEEFIMKALIVWPSGIWKEEVLDYIQPPPEAAGKGVAIWGRGLIPRVSGVFKVYVLINGKAIAKMPLNVLDPAG